MTTLIPYQEHLLNIEGLLSTNIPARPQSLFRRLNKTASKNKIQSKPATGEMSQYLDSGKFTLRSTYFKTNYF